MHTGDDLIAARHYVDAAKTHIERARFSQDESNVGIISVLSELAEGAKRIDARGISRSAQIVIEAIECETPEPIIQNKIHSLQQLIVQYTAGLDEIAPTENHEGVDPILDGLDAVRKTLKPLIKFVDTPAQAAALQTLIAFNASETTVGTKETNIEGVSLESLLPTITDLILSAARQSGKSVSVSYAANGVTIPNGLALDLQNFLIELGERLVAVSVESPMRRQVAGLPASGSLNVTASGSEGVLSLDVEVSGQSVDETGLGLTSLGPLIGRGASFSTLNIEGCVIARLSGLNISNSHDELLQDTVLEVAQ